MSQEQPSGTESAQATPAGVLEEAESLRKSGRAEAALSMIEGALVRNPGDGALRLAMALALLDLGRVEETRFALEQSLPSWTSSASSSEAESSGSEPTWPGSDDQAGEAGIADNELDSAFAAATSDSEQMLSADHVAQAALQSVEGNQPEGIQSSVLSDHTFQTPTMLGLLESQGCHGEAEQLRGAVSEQTESTTHPLIPTLERWLGNLRRDHR